MLAFRNRDRRLIPQEDGVNIFGTGIRHRPWIKERRMPDNRLMFYLPFEIGGRLRGRILHATAKWRSPAEPVL